MPPGLIGIRPASTRDRSRMPLISISRQRAEVMIVWLISTCSASRLLLSSIAPMPMIAFSGVRSSWLTLARNSDFAWLARSAWSRAFDNELMSVSA